MDLFDEVSKEKKEFPRTKSLKKSVEKRNYNFYQLFSFWLFVIIFFFWVLYLEIYFLLVKLLLIIFLVIVLINLIIL